MRMLQLPPAYPIATRNAKGELQTAYLPCGPLMEPDPNNVGHARLKAMHRGSPVRYGLSYVGVGLDNPVVVPAAGATGDLQFRDNIQEPGYLEFLQIVGVPVTPTVFLTDVSRQGDRFFSGDIPAQIFDPFAFNAPIFGHYIDTTVSLQLNIRQTTAVNINLGIAFTLM